MLMGFWALANSSVMLFCNIGVMTMKMISSTSITSTMGVTLMFEFTLLPSSRFAKAIRLPCKRCASAAADALTPALLAVTALQEVVHQFAGGVIHLDIERLYLIGEVVEHH